MKTTLMLIIFFLLFITNIHAQTNDSLHVPAQHVIYLEYAGLIGFGSLSLNYEHALTNSISFRTGVGIGYTLPPMDSEIGIGFTAMFNYITAHSDNRFEAGLGASLVYIRSGGSAGLGAIPAISIGYRYQPESGGSVYRLGLTWVYGFGMPLQASVGYAF